MKVPLGVRKGSWTEEEDVLLRKCIEDYGVGKWHLVSLRAGLNRCRKSCRLRWLNYLRPHIKRGHFTLDEVDLIIRLHKLLGNRWSLIAGRLPGRTANDVKNYWNTHLYKKMVCREEEMKDKRTQMTAKTNIIKPQPRTFSKNLPWLRVVADSIVTKANFSKPWPITTTIDDGNIPSKNNFSTIGDDSISVPKENFSMTLPTSSMEPKDGVPWWESIVFDKENDNMDLWEEPNIASLWEEDNIASATKAGDTFLEQCHSGWN